MRHIFLVKGWNRTLNKVNFLIVEILFLTRSRFKISVTVFIFTITDNILDSLYVTTDVWKLLGNCVSKKKTPLKYLWRWSMRWILSFRHLPDRTRCPSCTKTHRLLINAEKWLPIASAKCGYPSDVQDISSLMGIFAELHYKLGRPKDVLNWKSWFGSNKARGKMTGEKTECML